MSRRICVDDQKLTRLVSHVACAKGHHRMQQKPGTHGENEGRGNFGNNESIAESRCAMADHSTGSVVFQSFRGINARCSERGNEG